LANWLVGPNASGVRVKLAAELAKMLDAAAAADARSRIARGYADPDGCSWVLTHCRLLCNLLYDLKLVSPVVEMWLLNVAVDTSWLALCVCCAVLRFNNIELANRLVPVQPSEEESRKRASLLLETLFTRMNGSSAVTDQQVAAAAAPVAAVQPGGGFALQVTFVSAVDQHCARGCFCLVHHVATGVYATELQHPTTLHCRMLCPPVCRAVEY
jgi:hypothetical protein